MDIIKEYANKIEIMLAPLGIVTKNVTGKLKKYIDIDRNTFKEIKKHYIKTFISYDESMLN